MQPIDRAVEILRNGGLVAFPTETVYGLGADATSLTAVRRIFVAKGRPSTNPLIVHVADEETARRFAADWPRQASVLARTFWPGPLTLVVRKAAGIATEVSAGRATVGLRAPDHPVALEMLRAFGGAVAAPSANRSTRVSPTTAQHVRDELGPAVDLILDGGPCRVGIESTVLDLSGNAPTILRPGAVTRHEIESVIGRVELFQGSTDATNPASSPGQHAIHYAPRAPAYRFSRDELDPRLRWLASAGGAPISAVLVGEIPDSLTQIPFALLIEAPKVPEEFARQLYAALRRLDSPDVHAILVEMPPDKPEWAAVRDRITRATQPLPA
ncbi:MAG: Sua5/YciO/YrdC/YwlC family protein [Phycisphaerales bacterium]|nr:Sua5/YciO/YrdC/YwlC family protein [Phycisphaerales bacterium]